MSTLLNGVLELRNGKLQTGQLMRMKKRNISALQFHTSKHDDQYKQNRDYGLSSMLQVGKLCQFSYHFQNCSAFDHNLYQAIKAFKAFKAFKPVKPFKPFKPGRGCSVA